MLVPRISYPMPIHFSLEISFLTRGLVHRFLLGSLHFILVQALSGSRDSQHHRPSPAIETCWLSSSGHLILSPSQETVFPDMKSPWKMFIPNRFLEHLWA